MSARFGIYWTPPLGSALWNLASALLGRDAATGLDLPRPELTGIDPARVAELTGQPGFYGLHATLKPPFRLKPGAEPDDLLRALAELCLSLTPFDLPALEVTVLDGFLALRPSSPSPELEALAKACVCDLDRFRAEPEPRELAKRQAHGLSPAQEEMLKAWGYPYVLDEYRFHVSLTGRVGNLAEREKLQLALDDYLRGALADFQVNEVCLFEQAGPNVPFRLTRRFALGPSLAGL